MADQTIPEKACQLCGAVKPLTDFGKNSGAQSGLMGRCRQCENQCGRDKRRKAALPPPPDLPGEEWREIPGYEGYYSASDMGRIRREAAASGARIGRILSTRTYKHSPYPSVVLSRDCKTHIFTVHKLVVAAFHGPIPAGLEVDHISGDKSDNRLVNLELVTHLENVRRAVALGLTPAGDRHPMHLRPEVRARGERHGSHTHPESRPKGEEHGMAKLTGDDVREIMRRLALGHRICDIAKDSPASRQTVGNIKSGKNWSHVTITG